MKIKFLIATYFITFISFAQCWNQISAGYEHSAGIKSDGTLWTWGKNTAGQLGDGTTTNRLDLTQIGTDTNWTMVSASQTHTVALKSNGTMWSWGTASGQVTNFSSTLLVPTQIGTDTDWAYINTSDGLTFAIKTNGELWTWGADNYGRIGRVANGALPAKVITTGGQVWVEAGGSATHSVGLKSDGTIWAWGNGADGRLGNSSFVSQVTPVQVGTATDWKSIKAGADHCIAVKTTGTLWVWGKNDVGQLGTGSYASPIIYPVQIGGLTTWDKISAGYYHNLAIRINGTLWSWGSNTFGQLGIGNFTTNVNPIQVGTLTNYTSIEAGCLHSSALTTFAPTNKAWTWGSNGSGRLGDGASTTRSNPFNLGCPTSTLSSQDFNQNNLKVALYPNPVRDILNIESENDIQSVEIYNIQGQKVISSNQKQINVSDLASGMYLVRIQDIDNNIATKKIAIK